ncbi:hypothetical protein HanIR_Chr11g0552351 [Helianthus annuus]|nr:hypothetical protein HanIR_Chr11g0552351 [Helianthus annuus]
MLYYETLKSNLRNFFFQKVPLHICFWWNIILEIKEVKILFLGKIHIFWK